MNVTMEAEFVAVCLVVSILTVVANAVLLKCVIKMYTEYAKNEFSKRRDP